MDKGVPFSMLSKSNLILTAPPADSRAAGRFGLPVGHVAYRVGGGPHLFRASMPVSVRGGLMVVDNTGFSGGGETGPLLSGGLAGMLRPGPGRGHLRL